MSRKEPSVLGGLNPESEDLAPSAIEPALDIARGVLDARDAQTMRDLRARLDALMGSQEARALTRKNALSLLRTISEGLKPSTDQLIDNTDEMLVIRSHPALELLDELIDAFSDLDIGKSDPSLRPSPHQANAFLTTKQRKSDQVLRDAVLIVQRVRGYKNRSEAEHFLSKQLRKADKLVEANHIRPRC